MISRCTVKQRTRPGPHDDVVTYCSPSLSHQTPKKHRSIHGIDASSKSQALPYRTQEYTRRNIYDGADSLHPRTKTDDLDIFCRTKTGVKSRSFIDDPIKKTRQAYTTTKSRESWTEQEYKKVIEALQRFDQNWQKNRLQDPHGTPMAPSSGGCRHYGRGGRPSVGRPQANGVQARYQPAGGLARKLSVSSWRTSTLQGGPASRLPPRSSMETTSYGGPIRFTRQADHHKAVPSGKAQRRLEGPPSATVGSSIPFATSPRHRRRQQRAKGEVAVGATGEAITESAAIMLKSRPTRTRRWSRPPSVEPPRSVRPTDWYVPRLRLQHGYQRETTPAHLSRGLDKKHRDDVAPLPRLIACLRRAGGRGVFDDWQRTTK